MHRLLHTFKTEKIVFIDQITGDRPADNAAHNQTEGCRSNSHSRRPLRAHLFEQRTEGTSRTMPADHRDRTRRHTDQRPQIKTEASPIPTRFCRTISTAQTATSFKTLSPPSFSIRKLAV